MTEHEKTVFESFYLYNIDGIGSRTLEKLITGVANAHTVFEMSDQEMDKKIGKTKGEILRASLQVDIEKRMLIKYENMQSKGISFCSRLDSDYPEKLRTIPDPPFAIYYKGKLPTPYRKQVAIVGARLCSEYGRYVTRLYAKALAESGAEIISGMAAGIDAVGQKAALEASGRSFAVLGCGVDICYPQENRNLYQNLIEQGGIISEFPPGTQPISSYFPMRNRIISGLSDCVLIMEARQKSGTLITADMALEQGRELYCLPGRVTDQLSHGCNRLIGEGAGILIEPSILIENLGLGLKSIQYLQDGEEKKSNHEQIILQILEAQTVTLQELYNRVKEELEGPISLSELMTLVAHMSAQKIIQKSGLFLSKNS